VYLGPPVGANPGKMLCGNQCCIFGPTGWCESKEDGYVGRGWDLGRIKFED